jgi:hypothetical protein
MNPVTGLALGRIAIGLLSFLSPALAAKLFRLDAKANPQSPYLSRMFGSREIALGAAALTARGTTWRNVAIAGVAIDAADAASGYLAGRDGYVSKPTSAFLTAPALGAVAAGIAGLWISRRGVS